MYHFDKATWLINTEGKGVRIPTWLVLVLAPLLGALFVIYMPLAGFYLSVKALLDKLIGIVSGASARSKAGPLVAKSDEAAAHASEPR